jgi:hypothetical protein
MKRLYSFTLTVIIVLSVPQIGNASISATNLKQWRELTSSLDPNFTKDLDYSAEKNQSKSGWQSSEPKLVKRAPTLIKPDYQQEFANVHNFQSSLISEGPRKNIFENNLNIHTTRLKHEFSNTIDIPRIEVEKKFYTYISLQNHLLKPSIEDAAPSLLLDDSFLYQNYPDALKPVIALVKIGDQKLQLYERGKFLSQWDISSARPGKITPLGSWTAKWLSRNHKSSIYDGAEMPYSVFFNGDYAIHGTRQVNKLGEPASAGCIRLHPENAKIFFELARLYGVENTLVKIVN